MAKPHGNLKDIRTFVEIVAALRAPDGCPWDREQTHSSLARYAIEETFEMVEALEEREAARSAASILPKALTDKFIPQALTDKFIPQHLTDKFKDELGDVLFQVVLHSQLAQE
ncbi:MAG: hypothetical protein EOP06_21070, partial [Proteobacteria bacterium]